jgi:hypothetical protein
MHAAKTVTRFRAPFYKPVLSRAKTNISANSAASLSANSSLSTRACTVLPRHFLCAAICLHKSVMKPLKSSAHGLDFDTSLFQERNRIGSKLGQRALGSHATQPHVGQEKACSEGGLPALPRGGIQRRRAGRASARGMMQKRLQGSSAACLAAARTTVYRGDKPDVAAFSLDGQYNPFAFGDHGLKNDRSRLSRHDVDILQGHENGQLYPVVKIRSNLGTGVANIICFAVPKGWLPRLNWSVPTDTTYF